LGINITISEVIKSRIPEIRLGCIRATVEVKPATPGLLKHIDEVCDDIRGLLQIDGVSQVDTIAATRAAYRKLGKDPARYRPSAEALTRRVLQGKSLYRVNNIVDALNSISLASGFSIGGYDLATIEGQIELGVGLEGEPYQAIGRGMLNIESLPVLRDKLGPFGSPTSDSDRTMITALTGEFLMVFFDFSKNEKLENIVIDSTRIYETHCGVKQSSYWII